MPPQPPASGKLECNPAIDPGVAAGVGPEARSVVGKLQAVGIDIAPVQVDDLVATPVLVVELRGKRCNLLVGARSHGRHVKRQPECQRLQYMCDLLWCRAGCAKGLLSF